MTTVDLLCEQTAYYRARAPEYDHWWQRSGRYDRGPEATTRWNEEVSALDDLLAAVPVEGDVLELASGTGWWTQRLARRASTLTCLDASPETIAISRARLADAGLRQPAYEQADLFAWRPSRRYDVVFFSFWLSHVPAEHFARFWAMVADALVPNGRAIFIDSLAEPTSTASDHHMPDAEDVQERRLDDGRSFRIVKRFYDPAVLTRDLDAMSWTASVKVTGRYFLFGVAKPNQA